MNKQAELDRIASDITNSDITPELKKSATQLVPGSGNPDADIIFIGEAPGQKEDDQGEPFVGAAGKFLNEMLASIGMDRDSVFITNIVKYRPPNNRDPLHEEKLAFLPYLMRQLKVISPKLVVTLGRHSMENFLPNKRISEVHGQPMRIKIKGLSLGPKGQDRITILPLYHPAAALYNGSQRQTLMDDFALIPTILDKLKNN
ncbi:MAG: uracil-DNA glycosylase [Candidatus Saccharimonadales bacterium]